MRIKQLLLLFVFIILITFGALFISGDLTSFKYKVRIVKCQSEKVDTLTFTTKGKSEKIETYREAVPVLVIGEKRIIDICDYQILSKVKQ